MKYLGGKSKTADAISSIINNIAVCENINNYYEPFVGGGSVIEKVNIQKKYGSDLNKYLIAFYKYLQSVDKVELPSFTRDQFYDIFHNKHKYDDYIVYHAGVHLSFRANWFRGYDSMHDIDGINAQLNKELPYLRDISFSCNSYNNIEIDNGSIIYCDAPYINTAGYYAIEKKVIDKKTNSYKTSFDFNKYYEWLLNISKNNLVFISEYAMPADKFKIIKSFTLNTNYASGLKNNIDKNNKIENLYVVRGGWLVDKYFPDADDDSFDF